MRARAHSHTHTNAHKHTPYGEDSGGFRDKSGIEPTAPPLCSIPADIPKILLTKMLSDRKKKGERGSERTTEWHLVKEETACLYYFLPPGS